MNVRLQVILQPLNIDRKKRLQVSDLITSVCLNPCIDKALKVEEFRYGGLNRIAGTNIDGSGKGINVSIASRELGCEAACIGFLYYQNGDIISRRLEEHQVSADFLWEQGEVRTNIKIVDLAKNIITEVNEKGARVSEQQMAHIRKKVREYAHISDLLIFTGSLPPGCPIEFYKTLIEEAAGTKAKCILDAEGEILVEGCKAVPFLIKPNLYELERATDLTLSHPRDVCRAALLFIEKGISIVAVSMGGDGAVITDGKKSYFAPPVSVAIKNTVGAGDSMVAGFCKGIEDGMPLKELFKYGVAAATASVMTEGTQLFSKEDVLSLLDQVEIQEILL